MKMPWKLFVFFLLPLAFFEATLRVFAFIYIPPTSPYNTKAESVLEKSNGVWNPRPIFDNIFRPTSAELDDPTKEFRLGLVGGSSVNNLAQVWNTQKILKLNTDKKISILNFGGVSYGTVRLVLHFPELVSYKPNVIFVYSGHNEFEENLINELRPSKSLVKANLFLSQLRLYQLVSWGIHKIGGHLLDGNKYEAKLKPERRIRWDVTHNKQKVFETYRNNLTYMIQMAKAANIPVILGVPAYNRLVPPFQVQPSPLYQEAKTLYEQKKYSLAGPLFDKALDEDTNPHRATETSNNIVRQLAKDFDLPLIDMDEEVKKRSLTGIPGFDYLTDHCHLNMNVGNPLLEQLLAEKILELRLLQR